MMRLTLGNVAGTLLAGTAVAAVSVAGGEAPGAGDSAGSAAVVPPSARDAAPTQEVQRHTLPGDRVAVHNLVGEVEIRRGSGAELTVTVRRSGPDAGRLEVATGEVDGRQSLRVVYPSDRVVYEGHRGETELRMGDDGSIGGGWLDGREVEISGSGSGLRAHADLVVEVPEGADLEVHTGVGPTAARGVAGTLALDAAAGTVEVEDHDGALSVDTGSGSVRVSGVRGDLEVDTGSGSVEIGDVEGGRVGLDTGSGGIRGTGVAATELDADTGSGGIELDDVSAPRLRLDTGSGSIRLALRTDADHLEADTGSGSVTLVLPDDFGSALSVETGSGGVDFDGLDVDVRHMGDDGFQGSIGDGQGQTTIDTGSGSVRLLRG